MLNAISEKNKTVFIYRSKHFSYPCFFFYLKPSVGIRNSCKDGNCSSSSLWRFGAGTWQWRWFYILSKGTRFWQNWGRKEVTTQGEIRKSSFPKSYKSLQASFLYMTSRPEMTPVSEHWIPRIARTSRGWSEKKVKISKDGRWFRRHNDA